MLKKRGKNRANSWHLQYQQNPMFLHNYELLLQVKLFLQFECVRPSVLSFKYVRDIKSFWTIFEERWFQSNINLRNNPNTDILFHWNCIFEKWFLGQLCTMLCAKCTFLILLIFAIMEVAILVFLLYWRDKKTQILCNSVSLEREIYRRATGERESIQLAENIIFKSEAFP